MMRKAALQSAMEACLTGTKGSSDSIHLVEDDLVVIAVNGTDVFHPSLPLLQAADVAFDLLVCILRLHPQIASLIKALRDDGYEISAIFRDIALSVTGHSANATTNAPSSHRFCADSAAASVNLRGGGLCAFEDEAEAKSLLSSVSDALAKVQSSDDLSVLVLVEHCDGYVGQLFSTLGDCAIVRIDRKSFASGDATLDTLVERRGEDVALDCELAHRALPTSRSVKLSVNAGFNLWTNESSSLHRAGLVDMSDVQVWKTRHIVRG